MARRRRVGIRRCPWLKGDVEVFVAGSDETECGECPSVLLALNTSKKALLCTTGKDGCTCVKYK
jgi:hypothetical protein